MSSKLIRKKVEELSDALVIAEVSDVKSLADIRDRLDFIGRWAKKQRHFEAENATGESCALIQGMIERRIVAREAEAAMESVGKTVTALQQLVLGGQARAGGASPRSPLIDEKLVAAFVASQSDVLDRLEALAREAGTPGEGESSDELRRIFHTLKGESAFLELRDVEKLCRAVEELLQEAPAGTTREMLPAVKDWLARSFAARSGKGAPPEPVEKILEVLELLAARGPRKAPRDTRCAGAPPPAPAPPSAAVGSFTSGDTSLLASFIAESKEHLDSANVHLLTLETHPNDSEALDAVFRSFHTIKGITGLLDLNDIKDLAHEVESLLDGARKGDLVMSGAPIDIVFESIEMLKTMVDDLGESLRTGRQARTVVALPAHLGRIRAVASRAAETGDIPYQPLGGKLGDILVESGKISRDVVETALSKQKATPEKKKLGEILIKEMGISGRDIAHALRSQKQPPALKEQIKVDHERLDRLIDTVGELVIAVSMVSQNARSADGPSPGLARHVAQLEKITRELQEMGTALRMIPVRPTFQKMGLLVRDLAKKSGKTVSFEMVGEDTELDKNIVDKIGDPLTHLIRNAVDHGLEGTSEERRISGKGEAGRIALRAFHKGGNIWIEVEDDGRGFNRNAIVAKAIERGMIRDADNLSDRDVFGLTFKPGFSTSETVTEISGRGVGLDVVQRNVESLRGQIEIDSEEGKGSVCRIRLPLTLAIIDGMVVRAGSERYIIPALSIIRSVKPEAGSVTTVLDRGELLSIQGNLIPLFRLGTLFNVDGYERNPSNAVVVVVENAGRQAGLLTDELLGKQQTVIKPLGDNLTGLPGIAGGAIMPDGQVGLILDVGELVKLAHSAA